MRILRSNLESALVIAIRSQQAFEEKMSGPKFESIFVAGLKEALEAVRKGEHIEISDE